MATYAGSYDLQTDKDYDKGTVNKFKRISEQAYQYYQPGEKVRMLKPDGTYNWSLPGKEMDITMESKQVSEQTIDFGIEIDLTIGLVIPPPVYVTGVLGHFSFIDKGISSHSTTKVVRYPVILKKVTAFEDGVHSVTENLAFNLHTGQPVLTRTYDHFNGKYIDTDPSKAWEGAIYTLNLPASWYYPQMGQKTSSANNTNELTVSAGNIVSYGSLGNPLRDNGTWQTRPLRQVISASAQTFQKGWFPAPASGSAAALLEIDYPNIPSRRDVLNNIWRPKASYVYRTDVKQANLAGSSVYRGGYIDILKLFGDWNTTPSAPEKEWILTSQVTAYSPHGNALEEKDALNINKAVHFGYHDMMPVMVSANARYTSILFEDFENNRAGTTGTLTTAAHTGKKSYNLGSNPLVLGQFLSDEHLRREGALVKAWVRSNQTPDLSVGVGSATLPMELVGRTQEWVLMSAVIPSTAIPSSGTFPLSLINNTATALPVDDVRFQPRDGQSTCYVYDVRTLRLLAQFDDQHFGMIYQYNNEGKLVRKLIETERGLKTVAETQYHAPRELRPRKPILLP
jgi:hypothetical protein